jgi:hypothetical protein
MNESPYPGTKLVLADGGEPEASSEPAEGDDAAADDAAADDAAADDAAADESTDGEATDDGETYEPDSSGDATASDVTAGDSTDAELAGSEDSDNGEATRPPAFAVPGAPAEPLDEMPLPDRARELEEWATKLSTITPAALDHFAYQHAWIVTGAGFGWWRGAEALRTLIRVDEKMQSRFDVGREHEAQARAALAEVERKSSS